MKNRLACLVLAFGCCTAGADELLNGITAWEQQDYAQAHWIFNKLAVTGNPEAQRQLGEMIGFGEGVPEDLVTARRWLERSIDAGNKDAAASLELVERRSSHKAAIQRYLTSYDGSELALDKYNCVQPVIPASSETRKTIAKVSQQFGGWYECYGRFVKGLQAAAPAELTPVMNTVELAQAQSRMIGTLSRVAAEGRVQAEAIQMAERDWILATEKKARANDTVAKQMVEFERIAAFQRLVVVESRPSFASSTPPSSK